MNSQVYPLPNRAEAEEALRSEPAFNVTVQDRPRPVGQALVDLGRLSADDTRLIQDYQTRTGTSFADAGISLGLLDVEDLRAVHPAEFGQVLLAPESGIADEVIAAHLESVGTAEARAAFKSVVSQGAVTSTIRIGPSTSK